MHRLVSPLRCVAQPEKNWLCDAWGLAMVVPVRVAAQVACSSSSKTDATTPSTTAPASDECGPAPASPRTALLCNMQFDGRNSVVVELHPAAQPPVVLVPSGPGVSACPAALPFSGYPALKACIALDPARGTALPPTTGNDHVAFALRASKTPVANATVSITYTAVDRHFVVAPGTGQPGIVVAFTPAKSDVIGVAVLGPKLGFASGGTSALAITQGGASLTPVAATPAEHVESEEVVRVAPGVPVAAALKTSAAAVAMLLEWD
jgi:hypothetical protein